MLSPSSDVANITLAHCDAVGRGHPLHHFSAEINSACPEQSRRPAGMGRRSVLARTVLKHPHTINHYVHALEMRRPLRGMLSLGKVDRNPRNRGAVHYWR